MNETLQNVLYPLLFAVITGFGVTIAKYLIAIANAKIDKLQAGTKLAKHAQLNKYVDVAQVAISTAVATVSQTYVDDIKKAGNFNSDAQTKAKTDAIALAKTLITDDTKSAITELFGDFETYLSNSIEEVVAKIK